MEFEHLNGPLFKKGFPLQVLECLLEYSWEGIKIRPKNVPGSCQLVHLVRLPIKSTFWVLDSPFTDRNFADIGRTALGFYSWKKNFWCPIGKGNLPSGLFIPLHWKGQLPAHSCPKDLCWSLTVVDLHKYLSQYLFSQLKNWFNQFIN